MSARKRAAHRRIQPYAWLGAGAVTLGMGAAMVGGTAVAFASTGTDAPDNTSTSASTDAAPAKGHARAEASRHRAARAARSGSGAGDAAAVTPVLRGRVAAAVQDAISGPAAAVEAAAASTAADNNTSPVAADSPKAGHPRSSRIARDLVAAVVPSQSDAVAAPAAAVASPAASATPSVDSWLPGAVTPGGTNPGNQIIPGQHVQLAMEEIAVTQGMIKAATWGSGNFIAGIGSLGPQALLATAQLSLTIWGATNAGVQNFLSAVAKIPVVNLVGRAAVVGEMLVPRVSEISLGVASLLVPTLGWVGADVTSAEAVLASARSNGKVYSIVPMRVKLGTEPTVKAKLNGGRKATYLVDTGASGIEITRDKIGDAQLGPMIGSGISGFSGGLTYSYETYNMTVDLGDGATTTAPVNIITDTPDTPECPDCSNSVENFKTFINGNGADGIMGIGANTPGPGPAPIPTSAMPGELSDGVLMFQSLLPLGLGGVMVLGPNPLPAKASVPGASDAYVQVSINGGPKQDGAAIIDSGGVFGTLNDYFMPGQTGAYVPAGTKIDVYTADGSTLLYSYTTKSENSGRGTEFISDGLFNTGNAPFASGPVYINYGFDQPYGQGSTDFSIW